MSMDFDREQKEAIEARNRNVLVSASAGAGKTRVLVARLIKRCVDDRVSLDRILAVTFTEAAAAEMKKRVAAELNRRFDEENDADTRQWISAQLARLVNAQITTIDSWCLTVIQKYCSVIGLDPATADNILDEGTAQALRSQAFDLALREYDAAHHECIAALPNRLWTRSDLDGYGLPEADCRKILEFSASSLYQQALKMRIEKEYPFYVLDPEKQQILTGAMDFVAFGDHEILLVDFKSDSASPAELKRRYGTQIAAYERALHLMAPDAVIHSWIYSFHNSEAVAVRE